MANGIIWFDQYQHLPELLTFTFGCFESVFQLKSDVVVTNTLKPFMGNASI